MPLQNLAMQRKLDEGWLVDVSQYQRLGPYYVVPWDDMMKEWEAGRVDFADTTTETWIWSIGRCLQGFHFTDDNANDGVEYIARAGMVLASPGSDLYKNALFECVWLR